MEVAVIRSYYTEKINKKSSNFEECYRENTLIPLIFKNVNFKYVCPLYDYKFNYFVNYIEVEEKSWSLKIIFPHYQTVLPKFLVLIVSDLIRHHHFTPASLVNLKQTKFT